MKKLCYAFLPPLLLLLILSAVYFLPQRNDFAPSAISPNLPIGYSLDGWYGIKQQESDLERAVLPPDTRFSKASYESHGSSHLQPVEVSIVYSGADMNSSIHRPERCLPSQGHLNLQTTNEEIVLKDGRKLSISKLVSNRPWSEHPEVSLRYINYYLFIGNDSIRSSHLGRTFQDMWDRVFLGRVQRWAYFQAGSCWAPELKLSEQECDARVRALISELLPDVIDWSMIKEADSGK